MASDQEGSNKKRGSQKGKPKHRSPGYPAISLPDAIERARLLYEAEKRHPMPLSVAAQHWKMKPTSGGVHQYVAALKKFGLFDEVKTEKSQERRIQISEMGFNILIDERANSPDRMKLIQEAALKPNIHSSLWKEYDGELPTDANLRHYLLTVLKFNDKSVDSFISEFKETISFACLGQSAVISTGWDDEEDKTPSEIQVGDYVQWESQGQWQFESPRRVLGIHEDGEYIFVEGTKTGIPIKDCTKEAPPEGSPTTESEHMTISPEKIVPPTNPHFSKGDSINLSIPMDKGMASIVCPKNIGTDSFLEIIDTLFAMSRTIAGEKVDRP